MPYFYKTSEVMARQLVPGVTLRAMWGERILMSYLEMGPNCVVPMHTHPHEQCGLVLEGEFDMTIGGETRRMKPGDAYVIPGGVPHAVQGLDGTAIALDIFSPPREEYKPEQERVVTQWKQVKA